MITIRQPINGIEARAGLKHIAVEFQKHFGTFPSELPDQLFLAVSNGQIVGTINLQTNFSSEQFEVERFFKVDLGDYYLGPRSEILEMGRLTSNVKGLGPYLMCAAIRFAQSRGVNFFISFNRESVSRMVSTLYSMPVTVHQNIELRLETIPRKYYPYFLHQSDPVCVTTWYTRNWVSKVDQLLREAGKNIDIILPNELRNFSEVLSSKVESKTRPSRSKRVVSSI